MGGHVGRHEYWDVLPLSSKCTLQSLSVHAPFLVPACNPSADNPKLLHWHVMISIMLPLLNA